MNKTLSNKIQILSFYSIVMVVFRHSYNLTNTSFESDRNFLYYVEYLFSAELGNLVVIPLFFFLSGYLFFFNNDFKLITFKYKIKKRFFTLLLPYLIWCLFWFLVVYLVQYLPQISGYFDKPINTMSWNEKIWIAFVDPINYPFWFIRELMLFVLISPLLYYALKHLNYFFLIILIVLIFLKQPSLFRINDVSIFQFMGLLFFSAGSYASIYKINLISHYKTFWYILLILLWCVCIFLNFYTLDTYNPNHWSNILTNRIVAIIGFLSIWLTYDLLYKKFNLKNRKLYSYKFFIFAAHGIFVSYFTKTYLLIFGENIWLLLVLYFTTPILIITLCIIFANLFQHKVPKFYSLLTGSR